MNQFLPEQEARRQEVRSYMFQVFWTKQQTFSLLPPET